MMRGDFVWYELLTTDVAKAQAFYTSVVGWRARDASAPGAPYTLFMRREAPAGGLMELPPDLRQAGAMPRWLGYVGIDVDGAAVRIIRHGGIIQVPPTAIPGVSRFAIFDDPQGASLALIEWLGADRDEGQAGTPDPNAPGSVGWHELLAADTGTALAFYGEVFDWRKAGTDFDPTGTYQLFSVGERTIGGMSTKPAAVPVAFWLYYFTVEDIDAAAERVRGGGGEVVEGPVAVQGGGWVARCIDPQGAAFALVGPRSKKALGYFARATAPVPGQR
jgi:predicted enzyme related to lactoylglutathione lyase